MASKPDITPRLVVIEGKEKGKIIPLHDGTAVIGRSKGDVLVHDPRISRSHVALHFDSKTGKLTFTDLKSLNGTLVNDETQESGELHDGDKLQLGNTKFDCQLQATESLPAVQEPRESRKLKPVAEDSNAVAEKRGRDDEPRASSETNADSSASEPVLEMEPEPEGDARLRHTELRVDNESPKETKSRFRLPSLKPSPRTRNIGAAALLAVLAFYYLGKGGGKTSSPALEREMASIKALQTQGKIEEAVTKATDLSTKFPEDSSTYFMLGDLLASQKKYEPAIAAYLKAHELQPPQPLVHLRLIRVYLPSGLKEGAEEELRHVDQLLKTGVHSKELFIEAGTLFLDFKELKQPPEKTIILAKALQTELAPASSIGYKLEAQVLFQQNRADEAVAALEKGLAIDPQDEWILENIAFAKLSAKDIPGAQTAVDMWIKARPANTKALLVMAYLKFNEKNYLAALPYVQKILQVSAGGNNQDPHYPEALDLMGQIYQQQGQNQEAANFFKQGCEAGFQGSCEKLGMQPPATAKAPDGAAAPQAAPQAPLPAGAAPQGGAEIAGSAPPPAAPAAAAAAPQGAAPVTAPDPALNAKAPPTGTNGLPAGIGLPPPETAKAPTTEKGPGPASVPAAPAPELDISLPPTSGGK